MEQNAIQVAELARLIRETVEDSFDPIWVEGEISNLKTYPSGHSYFTLKDDRAQLSCVMWKSRQLASRIRLSEGGQMRLLVQVVFYEKGGRLQLDVQQVRDAGLGSLMQRLQQLKEKLQDEGLFRIELKQPLPDMPRAIGVVTSPAGAAIQDIKRVMSTRLPDVRLLLYPARVQGEEAAGEIVAGIRWFNQRNDIDLLIVGRGGGSLEDLWPFNEEQVARAIFRSRIPVISAVGHEIDVTISDLVADVRAATPSAAAEIALPGKDELLTRIGQFENRLRRQVTLQDKMAREHLRRIRNRYALKHPLDLIQRKAQKLDELLARLNQAGRNELSRAEQQVKGLDQQLEQQLRRHVSSLKQTLSHSHQLLQAYDPTHVLSRGYAWVETLPEGNIVTSSRQVNLSSLVRVTLSRGTLFARVEAKENS